MLTFDAPVAGNPALLAAAAISAGVAAAGVAYLVLRAAPKGFEPVAGLISETQLRLRRESGRRESALYAFLQTLLPRVARVTSRLPLDSLKKSVVERYARAGWPGGFTDDELMALSMLLSLILFAVLTIGAVIFDPILAPVGFIGLLLGPGLVSMKLGNMGSARDRDVTRVMPFVLDLLVLTMRAGASMTIAMDRVAQDYRRHPVGEEFRATLKDIEMGTTAKQAFHGLAARVPTRVIRGFVDEVIQSEELGRPIADTLERLSDRVRVTRVQEANVAAGSAKVMVLIPGMLVFIATLLLLFAPFAVKFYYGGIGLE